MRSRKPRVGADPPHHSFVVTCEGDVRFVQGPGGREHDTVKCGDFSCFKIRTNVGMRVERR